MSLANRGKKAEDLLQAQLKLLSSMADTHFFRFPDARAGSAKEAPADFSVLRRGKLYLLECKEVAHDYRLPVGNLSPEQVARMTRWTLAGAEAHVLIYHSTLKAWRSQPVAYYTPRPTGSWNFSEQPTQTLKELLSCLLC